MAGVSRVRAQVHRGLTEARGIVLSSTSSAGSRIGAILQIWRPGDIVQLYQDAIVVRFSSPRLMRAEHAPGELLVEHTGRLATFPLEGAALLAIANAASGSLLRFRGGVLETIASDQLRPWIPDAEFDLGEVRVIDVETLGAGPEPIKPPARAPEEDARKIFGVEPIAKEALAVRTALQQSAARAAQIRGVISGAVSTLKRWLLSTPTGLRQHSGEPSQGGPSWASGAWTWLVNRSLFLLSTLGMGGLWLAAHRRYLNKLERLFESGDVLEALRHALPLGGERSEGPTRLALTPPTPRTDLTIATGAKAAASVVPLDSDWMGHLRGLYERALLQLERTGQIDQAAFVMVELLNDVPRAISWLEKHGKLRLAAELAEARKQPVVERIRLWFLAGEAQRAVDLAIRHAAFADVISRLEVRDRAAALKLRMIWADHCATRGEYLQAARAAWPVSEANALIRGWLNLAIRAGGPSASAAWVARLRLEPECLPDAYAALVGVLEDEHPEAPMDRGRLAEEIVKAPSSTALDALVPPLLRALLRDASGHVATSTLPVVALETLRGLLGRAPVLRADWPQLHNEVTRNTVRLTSLKTVTVSHSERGTLPIHDVVALSGGRVLVALGQLGAMLLTREGTRLIHWDREPVSVLIPSPSGERVITADRRAGRVRAGRLDIATRRHERWIDVELATFANRFDGSGWYVGTGGSSPRVAYLDVTDAIARSLCETPIDGPITQIELGDRTLEVASSTPDGLEQWSYELPALILRHRLALPASAPRWLAADARSVAVNWADGGGITLAVAGKGERTFSLPTTLDRSVAPSQTGCTWPWLWLVAATDDGLRVDVLQVEGARHLASVRLEGASHVCPRIFGNLLILGDDLGRIVKLQLEHGHCSVIRV